MGGKDHDGIWENRRPGKQGIHIDGVCETETAVGRLVLRSDPHDSLPHTKFCKACLASLHNLSPKTFPINLTCN